MLPIPAFINLESDRAGEARDALARDGRFQLQIGDPQDLPRRIRMALAVGARRLLVAGGDGTLALAAQVVAEAGAEMAILPGGTMNHFARRADVPRSVEDALNVAATAAAHPQDVAFANDRLFLNTSSIGVYVAFVRVRERWASKVGHWSASAIAAVAILRRMGTVRVELEVDGQGLEYETPLVFIGVGERETKLPRLGGPRENGRRGLHVLVVRGRTRARFVALAFAAAARSIRRLSRTPHIDAFIVDRCRIDLGRGTHWVAFDGEICGMTSRIDYRIARDALRVVGHSAPSERSLASGE